MTTKLVYVCTRYVFICISRYSTDTKKCDGTHVCWMSADSLMWRAQHNKEAHIVSCDCWFSPFPRDPAAHDLTRSYFLFQSEHARAGVTNKEEKSRFVATHPPHARGKSNNLLLILILSYEKPVHMLVKTGELVYQVALIWYQVQKSTILHRSCCCCSHISSQYNAVRGRRTGSNNSGME